MKRELQAPADFGAAMNRSLTERKNMWPSNRLVSTGKLNTSLHLHLRPINLVVSEVPLALTDMDV